MIPKLALGILFSLTCAVGLAFADDRREELRLTVKVGEVKSVFTLEQGKGGTHLVLRKNGEVSEERQLDADDVAYLKAKLAKVPDAEEGSCGRSSYRLEEKEPDGSVSRTVVACVHKPSAAGRGLEQVANLLAAFL